MVLPLLSQRSFPLIPLPIFEAWSVPVLLAAASGRGGTKTKALADPLFGRLLSTFAHGMDGITHWTFVPGLPSLQFDNFFRLVHGVAAVVTAHRSIPQ